MNVKDLPKDTLVKAYFKEHDSRVPMIGKFVDCVDSKELASKGMIRFVPMSRLEYYNVLSPSIGLTKIYVAKDFTQVKTVDSTQVVNWGK